MGLTLALRASLEELRQSRERLLIAQAFLGAPSLLLLDEPLASLDPSHQIAIVGLVRRLQRELAMTVVMSSHELTPLLGSIDGVLYLGRKAVALGAMTLGGP